LMKFLFSYTEYDDVGVLRNKKDKRNTLLFYLTFIVPKFSVYCTNQYKNSVDHSHFKT